MRRCVWSRNLVKEEALAHRGLLRQKNKPTTVSFYLSIHAWREMILQKIMLRRSAGMVLQLALQANVLIGKCSEQSFTQSVKSAGRKVNCGTSERCLLRAQRNWKWKLVPKCKKTILCLTNIHILPVEDNWEDGMCKATRPLWLSKTHMKKVRWLTEHTYVCKLDNSTGQATYV